jgi:hypothetical protein
VKPPEYQRIQIGKAQQAAGRGVQPRMPLKSSHKVADHAEAYCFIMRLGRHFSYLVRQSGCSTLDGLCPPAAQLFSMEEIRGAACTT